MPKYFNKNLSYIRKQKKISQLDLAKKIGVDQSTISLWEKGMDITVENAFKVSEALGIPFPEFLGKDLSFDNGALVDISSDTIQIPVLGVIKAGVPIEAQQNILEYIDIPKDWIKGGKSFYSLLISGDSMFPKYSDRDIVIFEQTEDFLQANNKDCAVMVNGDDATFKKVFLDDEGITLQPYNNDYPAMRFNKEQIESKPVKIIGIAKEKRTRL